MERRDLPGNDASWYRALLVDDEPASDNGDGTAPEIAAEPAEAEPVPDLVVQPPRMTGDTEPVDFPDDLPDAPQQAATVAAVPALAEDDEAIESTSEMVGQLWTSQEPATAFDDWEPDDIDRKIISRRPFRWTSLVAALAVIALIVIGLVFLPSVARNRANTHREMMATALLNLRAELPDTQASLQIATEPESSITALNDLSTQLTVLTAKASAVDDAGRAELPSAPPLTSSAPIDELIPIQQRLEPLATTAQTIQRRISNVVEYRSLMSGFMVLPELPGEADQATQADLRVVLASAQAESAAILADLPSDVSLSEHQDRARAINEMFAQWQIDYLEALRTQDPLAAEALVADLQGRLVELENAIVTPLAQIRRQTDADLIDLARAIDEVRDLANDTSSAG